MDDLGDCDRAGATSAPSDDRPAGELRRAKLPHDAKGRAAKRTEDAAPLETSVGQITSSVTTITLIIQIEGFFNTGLVYGLLPISKVELTPKNKRKKTRVRASEVVKDAEEGSIVSVRYLREVRGLRRSAQSPAFLNSITIDVFIEGRIVSVKLSCDLVQLCGATSRGQGAHAVEYLLAMIAQIQKLVAWKNANKESADVAFDRVARDAQKWFGDGADKSSLPASGPAIAYSPEQPASVASNSPPWGAAATDLVPKTWAEWSSIKMLSREPDAQLLYEFLSCRYEQLASFEVFVQDLDWFRKLSFVADSELAIMQVGQTPAVDVSMLNRKFVLGRRIDLFDFKCYIHQRKDCKFFAHYDAACEKFLIVECKGTVPFGNFHRRSDTYFHTFMVYPSGVITQSGLGDDEMEQVSRDFIAVTSDYLQVSASS